MSWFFDNVIGKFTHQILSCSLGTHCHIGSIKLELVIVDNFHEGSFTVLVIPYDGWAFVIGKKITTAVARRDGTACYPGKGYSEECFEILKSVTSPPPGLLSFDSSFGFFNMRFQVK